MFLLAGNRTSILGVPSSQSQRGAGFAGLSVLRAWWVPIAGNA